MLKRAVIAFVCLFAAGCSQERASDNTVADALVAVGGWTAPRMAAIAARTRQQDAFASLPDRGDLVGYPSTPVTRRSGAFTWHQVEVSESHALQAIGSGTLQITAPNGLPLRLRYERHVEHPDGNWTWFGRDANGADAVLTFGEKATFGVIPTGDEELRLAMADGRAWLVQTDRHQHVAVDGAGRQVGPDFLVSPDQVQAAANRHRNAAAMQVQADTPSGAVTVDLVLGYTRGFASSLGGYSQTLTRLHNLVDITNQALANSQVPHRIRLSQTVQVDYPDVTSNWEALRRLTNMYVDDYYYWHRGLSPLGPQARRYNNADLVALVRKYAAPEQGGCGLAWLNGAGQSGINEDTFKWTYSVVSDGFDIDERDGRTYTCREESLAHQLGHNMGQAHNIQDAEHSGFHPYSYGYREEPEDSGFYTVMAVPSANGRQSTIRHFANPNVSYLGRPTGTSGADNARSLMETMPLIAALRSPLSPPPVRVRGDINADGKADLVLRNSSQAQIWFMDGARVVGTGMQSVGAGYQATLIADINGNHQTQVGRSEIIFRSDRTLMSAKGGGEDGEKSRDIGAMTLGWELFAASDLDGDYKSDLIFRNGSMIAFWLMDDWWKVYTGVVAGGAGGRYRATQADDLTGDGHADVVYEDSETHNLWLWVRQFDGRFQPIEIGTPGPGWELYTTADMNGDGKADLVFRNGSQLAFWLMDGHRVTKGILYGAAGGTYRVVQASDFNGDGRADILFQDSNRRLLMWMIGADYSLQAAEVGILPAEWELVPSKL